MAERGALWLLSLLCLTFLYAETIAAKHVDKASAAQPFSPFWFTAEPQDTLAIRGNSALLNCSAHSDAATRIEWKKDGTFMSLVSDERRRILPDGSLFFTHVVHSKHNKPDEGTYQCVATIDNLGSISSRTARLSVADARAGLEHEQSNRAADTIYICAAQDKNQQQQQQQQRPSLAEQ
ncbi:hypothetical protein PAMA_000732 [Pampus argenteus]